MYLSTLIAIVLALHVLGCVVLQSGTDLQGRINQYASVLSIDTCRNTVRLSTAGWLRRGDRFIIMQMLGGVADTSNTVACGSVIDEGGAGTWELCTVDTVMAGRVRPIERLQHHYDVKSAVQVIKVCSASTATVVAPVTGQPWNGSSGGVIAIECTDTLILRAPISVRGIGYRGGAVSVNTRDTARTEWWSKARQGAGGRKGEGHVVSDTLRNAGRGSWSTGGGGGNARNGGGGGGGHGGDGGRGGSQPTSMSTVDVGGAGGRATTAAMPDVLRMGGGGGGGHQNDFHGSAGAAGGGIVICIASTIIADSNAIIDCRGNDAAAATDDGAGGGGAGGTILVVTQAITGPFVCLAQGGQGGMNMAVGGCYAPGGGGAGGCIISTISLPAVSVEGGAAGRATDAMCSADPQHSATDGGKGSVVVRSVDLTGASIYVVPKITSSDTTVCARAAVELQAQGGAIYAWKVNDVDVDGTGPIVNVLPSKKRNIITCAIMTMEGCVFNDTVRVDTISCAEPTSDVGFRIDDVRGAPGDSVNIRIHVSTRDSIRYASTITYALLTRASVLVPFGSFEDSSTVRRPWRTSWFSMQTRPGMEDTTITIPMRLVLGDDERSMMTIDTFTTDDERVIPRLGRFGICSLDVCTDGGIRRFDPFATVGAEVRNGILYVGGPHGANVRVQACDAAGRYVPACIDARAPCEIDLRSVQQRSTCAEPLWMIVSINDHPFIWPCP